MSTQIQPFKETDELEATVTSVFVPSIDAFEADLLAFFENIYTCRPLGEILFANKNNPLVNVVPEEVFVTSYPTIFEFFKRPLGYESWLTLLRKIFGEEVEIEFDVPEPGILVINIGALVIENADALARVIEDGQYGYDEIITQPDSDNLAFQAPQGLTQQELDALINSLPIFGVSVQATLVAS